MRRIRPRFLEKGGPIGFPDPRLADADGLVAVGGDLSVARLIEAYRSGIFPWFDVDTPPLWWSPDPRGVLPIESLHVSRRLARKLRTPEHRTTWNRAFRRVMQECASGRSDGTWILPEMVDAYCDLHAAGRAHSLEVWRGAELVGGVYGVQVGGLFAAESMFHRESDMSKVALVTLVTRLFAAGVRVFDVQFVTPHLASLGAVEWPRDVYLERVRAAVDVRVDLADLRL